ncbi:hypothetical protein ACFC1R_38520, partial [Kitasatospora sp. NPDC056138]
MRGKEYLTAVRAEGDLLVAHIMHFADEVRDPHREVDDLPAADTMVGEKELSAAEQLIEMLAVDWNPEEWHDTFADQIRELIEAKATGQEIAVSHPLTYNSPSVDTLLVSGVFDGHWLSLRLQKVETSSFTVINHRTHWVSNYPDNR